MTDLYQHICKTAGNLRPRKTQKMMVSEAQQAVAKGQIIAIEASCGSGKGLAYLCATLEHIRAKKLKLVIATATVALQEQLTTNDLPMVEKYGHVAFTFGIAKGRGRYLCMLKLEQLFNNPAAVNWCDLEAISGYLDEGWNGDLDQLQTPIHPNVWRHVQCDSFSCVKQACQYYPQCTFIQNKIFLENADVIVTNHDFLLSDLRLGGGRILPPPTESLYVLDEGHHLVEKAKSQFTTRYRLDEILMCRTELAELLPLFPKSGHDSTITSLTKKMRTNLPALENCATRLQESLTAADDSLFKSCTRQSIWRLAHGKVPDRLRAALTSLLDKITSLYQAANELSQYLLNDYTGNTLSSSDLSAFISQLNKNAGELNRFRETITGFFSSHSTVTAPAALWIERTRSPESESSHFAFVHAPIDVSELLKDLLWDECSSAIVTSATLTTEGNFTHLFKTTGLSLLDRTQSLRLPTQFDHQRGHLVIPAMRHSPKEQTPYLDEVATLIPLITQKKTGSLILFTSKSNMDYVYDHLAPEWRQQVIKQGDLPKQEILKLHQERIAAKSRSIIFGMRIFSEGVDFPGALCETVVIVKIPFSVPITPQEQAAYEWCQANGGDPFYDISLPKAIIQLIQQSGRLLRTESDQGFLLILDNRMHTTRYGQTILSSLPDFTRHPKPDFKRLASLLSA